MKAENNRTKRIYIRLRPEELALIKEKFKNTTFRKLSEYARKVLLNKPVTVTYRNKALDAYLEEIVRLKEDLNAVGNNFNQAVKKLHSMNQVAEFRIWLDTWSYTKEKLYHSINEIKSRINNLPNELLR